MIKSVIRKLVRNCGFDIHRYNSATSSDAQFIEMLRNHKVNLIFDIGANIGQFGKYLRNIGYQGRIVSFEPLTSARRKLLIVSRHDPLWDVAPQAAIGSEDGEISIHISGNSVSSSTLNMLDSHLNSAPESSYIGSERVLLRCLDSLASQYLTSETILFIKIDTQGYEDQVIKGATQTLEKATGLQVELSLVPLYEGQRLYDYIVVQLKLVGFSLWGISPAFTDIQTGRLLQVDANFFR